MLIDEDDLKEFQKFMLKLEELNNATPEDFFEDKAGAIFDSYSSLFNRFCPLSVGDRVALTKSHDSGNQFLVEGAIATVKSRGYSNDKFIFYLEFHKTRIDSEGNISPINPLPSVASSTIAVTAMPNPRANQETHWIGEDWLKKLD